MHQTIDQFSQTHFTLIRLIWCSAHRASTSLTYIGSSQLAARAQRWAWRLQLERHQVQSHTQEKHTCGKSNDSSQTKLGNKGEFPHIDSVEGAKMSSVTLCVGNTSISLGFHLLVQGLGALSDASCKAIVNECRLEHFREGSVDIHDTSSGNAAPVNSHNSHNSQ